MAKVQRTQRVPVGGPRDILTVSDKDPNFVYRWVLSPRVERFKLGGYEIVTDSPQVGQTTVDQGSKVGSAVTRYAGVGQTLVLMRIAKEWYDEDQAAKMEQIDALERTMKQEAKEGRYGSFTITRDK